MSQTLGKGTSVGNSQMEWLYDSSSGKPTNDDYLMGKAVDKNFERMGTEGQINAVEYDCCPESIFSSQVDHQVDLQRKLQEDPLVSLRKKEVDTRKKILDNPLKLREITSYVSTCYCFLEISFDAYKNLLYKSKFIHRFIIFINFARLIPSKGKSTKKRKSERNTNGKRTLKKMMKKTWIKFYCKN